MEGLFLKLLELSLSGSLFVLAVLALRVIFQKAPKWVFCLLWGLVALRLVVPVSIESEFSLIPEMLSSKQMEAKLEETYVGEITVIQPDTDAYREAMDAGLRPVHRTDGDYIITKEGTLEAPPTVKDAVLPLVSWIWITGFAAMLAYTMCSYLALRVRVATATRLRDNIKQSECIDSPFVLGLLRPVIYLPYGISGKDAENVIAHEQAHIRRRDHWWKPIGFLILSIHWFNPLMWLAYILLCRDIEAACDEKVIRKMDIDGIRDYSTALLNCSIHRRGIAACPLAFGEVGVKDRIKWVMGYKKPAFWVVLLALAAAVAAAVLLLTNPSGTDNKLLGAYYHIEETLYDSREKNGTQLTGFLITGDYYFTAQKEGSNSWLSRKKMEPCQITAEQLESFGAEDGWRSGDRLGEISDAYLVKAEINHFYIAARTRTGDTLLAFCSGDPQSAEPEKQPKLIWLYRLESDMEPGSVNPDFIANSLASEAGITEVFALWETEENPGFLVAGFLSGYNPLAASEYEDMGYAVFHGDGSGYRLVQCNVYEDAAQEENGIFCCPDPAVLSAEGEIADDTAFDVILSCNEDLVQIRREYYREEKQVLSVTSQQTACPSMHLFRWEQEEKYDRVTQLFLDEEGKALAANTVEEKIMELVEGIAYNPSVAYSSNPYDYIQAKQEDFDEILSYDDAAAEYLIRCLRSTQDDGLKEYIMAAACAEIIGIGKDKSLEPWFSGKSWLALYDDGSTILGKPEDTVGASIQVDSLLGIDCVWMKIVTVEDHPYNRGMHLYSYRFYYHGDGKKYDTRQQEQYLLEIHNCIDYCAGDFDGDGIVELFVYTDAVEMPYQLYDLSGGQLVMERLSLIPEAVLTDSILFDSEGYYLYEERWNRFFQDPVAYLQKVAERPEERWIFILPSGTIPKRIPVDTVASAYERLNSFLDGNPTDGEKQLAYDMLNEMELSYTPIIAAGERCNYIRLLEKWSYTSSDSTEDRNCCRQLGIVFNADPVAFLRGIGKADESAMKKDLNLLLQWIVRENTLYDAAAFERILSDMKKAAATPDEKALAAQFEEIFRMEDLELPSMNREDLLHMQTQQRWNAFLCDPEQVVRTLGNTDSSMRNLSVWGIQDPGSRRLMDRAYAAVNKVLRSNPQGALKDVAYNFLLSLEWYGDYRDEYIPGKAFDYQRLFDKWTYSDGALATMCYSQMYGVFESNPAGFIRGLSRWEGADSIYSWEAVARDFAYNYGGSETYPTILEELSEKITADPEKKCLDLFRAAYQAAQG